jgi:Zn-finger nucleic acid-binding protein
MSVVCPHCNKITSEKSSYCAHCGGKITKKASITVATCPICKCPLEKNEYRGSTIDICPACNGIWLDSKEFYFHVSERDTFEDPEIPREFVKKPLEKKKAYIPCVRCGSLMARQNFRRISGVLIDICKDHGVWLDAGELEQIRSFIANGGLDKSQDRYIMENKVKIAQTAREVKDLNTLFKTLNKFDLRRVQLQGF